MARETDGHLKEKGLRVDSDTNREGTSMRAEKHRKNNKLEEWTDI